MRDTLTSIPPNTTDRHFGQIVDWAHKILSSASEEDVAFALSTDDDMLWPFWEYLESHDLISNQRVNEFWEAIRSSGHDTFIGHIMRLKEKYGVPRPLVLAKNMGRPLPFELDSWTISSASYPSGHAASSRYLAHVFSRSFLEGQPYADAHRCELFNIANRIAWGRVILGVHSFQDIREGKRLADAHFGVRDL